MRMSRLYRSRALVFVFAGAMAACKTDPPPAGPTGTISSASGDAAPSALDDALMFLESPAVTRDRRLASGVRFRLYSWTTKEQAEEMRKTKVLLSRTESPQHGPSMYDVAMQQAADHGDTVAALLRKEGFQKARFAWTSAWATRMAWPGESYGDVLLAIDVRTGAYVAKHDPASGTWDVVTTDGTPVGIPELLAHPERLGAVLFESDGTGGAPAYREFVLCNEAQIESFSFGMATELDELESEITGIETTAKALRANPQVAGVVPRNQVTAAWHDPLLTAPVDPPGKMRRVYLANVAFDNDAYVFTPEKLDAIAASLKAAKSMPPSGSVFTGAAKFAGPGATAPPPRPKPGSGSYYGTYMPRPRKGGHP